LSVCIDRGGSLGGIERRAVLDEIVGEDDGDRVGIGGIVGVVVGKRPVYVGESPFSGSLALGSDDDGIVRLGILAVVNAIAGLDRL
jgi:hypothetical protein